MCSPCRASVVTPPARFAASRSTSRRRFSTAMSSACWRGCLASGKSAAKRKPTLGFGAWRRNWWFTHHALTFHVAHSNLRTRTQSDAGDNDKWIAPVSTSPSWNSAHWFARRDSPQCGICPVKKLCVAFRENRVEELPNLGKREAATARRFIAFVVEQQWTIPGPPAARRRRERAFVGIPERGIQRRQNRT